MTLTLTQEIQIAARLSELKRLARATSIVYAALEAELLMRLRERRDGTSDDDTREPIDLPNPISRLLR